MPAGFSLEKGGCHLLMMSACGTASNCRPRREHSHAHSLSGNGAQVRAQLAQPVQSLLRLGGQGLVPSAWEAAPGQISRMATDSYGDSYRVCWEYYTCLLGSFKLPVRVHETRPCGTIQVEDKGDWPVQVELFLTRMLRAKALLVKLEEVNILLGEDKPGRLTILFIVRTENVLPATFFPRFLHVFFLHGV